MGAGLRHVGWAIELGLDPRRFGFSGGLAASFGFLKPAQQPCGVQTEFGTPATGHRLPTFFSKTEPL